MRMLGVAVLVMGVLLYVAAVRGRHADLMRALQGDK